MSGGRVTESVSMTRFSAGVTSPTVAQLYGGAAHLTPETVEEYFHIGFPTAIHLEGSSQLEIDPAREEVRLITPALGGVPDVAEYERIDVQRINLMGEEGDWFMLTVNAVSMHYEAYILIESIVDQLRGGVSFRHAVSESLSGLKDLLSSRERMTEEQEAGLIGELLVLEHVVRHTDEDSAISAWLGPMSEEHDFGFDSFDAEIKTTRSEGRVHRIGSESQLAATDDRPLYLVSVQITRSGNADAGFSLADRVAAVRQLLDRTRRTFDSALESLGWDDTKADLFGSRFIVRTTPRAYLVDADFPAITGARLDLVIPQRTLIGAVSYRVDVSHLPHTSAPGPIAAFCERTE